MRLAVFYFANVSVNRTNLECEVSASKKPFRGHLRGRFNRTISVSGIKLCKISEW